MLVLDLNSILALILLLDLLEAEDDLVWSGGPALAPWLGGEVLGALEPCDLGDGVTQDVENKKGIVSLCGGHLVCRLHILWFFSFSSKGR